MGMIQQTHRDLIVTPCLRNVLDNAMNRMGLPRPVSGTRRLFISRLSLTRSGAYRGLIQEESLIGEMIARGFEIIEPEKLSFREQVNLFRQASVVVGLGGAGMFNCIFCPTNSKVISVESTVEFAPWHANLFASCGLEYGIVFGEPDPEDASPFQKRWLLRLGEALAGIDSMLARWGFEIK